MTQPEDRDQSEPSGDPRDDGRGAGDDTRPIGGYGAQPWPAPEAPETSDRPIWEPRDEPVPGPPVVPPTWAQPSGQDWSPPAGPDRHRPEQGPHAWHPQTGYSAPVEQAGRSGGQPGWFWPVVASVALVVGLLGGTLASVAVTRSLGSQSDPIEFPALETSDQSDQPVEPLAADNGSIAAVAARLLPSTVQIIATGSERGAATGSGFVLDTRGHVITNNHVVAGSVDGGELTVVDHRGVEHSAEIVGRSPVYDVAVLRVGDPERLRPAALGSSRSMLIGESVVAIGSPLGLSSTVTSGIVSAIDRPVTTGTQDESSYINAVQTDAAINPGNSGGPLVNLRGQVVGVNSAIATTGTMLGGEAGNIGVGFAIPMEQVRITAAQILRTGEARYPVIGANVDTGEQQGGAEVVDVPSGTPAAAAGLQEGDVVTSVDGKLVNDGIGLIVAIRTHQPGETIELTVERGDQEVQVQITLDAKVG